MSQRFRKGDSVVMTDEAISFGVAYEKNLGIVTRTAHPDSELVWVRFDGLKSEYRIHRNFIELIPRYVET